MSDQLMTATGAKRMNRSNSEYKRRKKAWLADRIRWNGLYVCEICGRWTADPELDHIQNVGMGGSAERLLDENNWSLKCHLCHYQKTNHL